MLLLSEIELELSASENKVHVSFDKENLIYTSYT